ncbi:MAG: hypothetical protein C4527_05020 [Candidatus Omnitrophota bacterium]|nr:MAG: hypothetical protein C4527_05020 [Candidatus Omnitrophota bacterium]
MAEILEVSNRFIPLGRSTLIHVISIPPFRSIHDIFIVCCHWIGWIWLIMEEMILPDKENRILRRETYPDHLFFSGVFIYIH